MGDNRVQVFDSAMFQHNIKPSTAKPRNLEFSLKVSKSELPTRAFQEKAVDSSLLLLVEHFAIYAESIGFPELVLPACRSLRQFVKNCRVQRINKQIMAVVKKVCERGR